MMPVMRFSLEPKPKGGFLAHNPNKGVIKLAQKLKGFEEKTLQLAQLALKWIEAERQYHGPDIVRKQPMSAQTRHLVTEMECAANLDKAFRAIDNRHLKHKFK